MTQSETAQPLLRVDDITKHFGAVQALQGISFTIEPGQVVTLVGDNGAGKSTLARIISGAYQPSGGAFYLAGEPCDFENPAAARAAGIETVYQHLALIEQLAVADNIYLGREQMRGGLVGRLLGLLDRASGADTYHMHIEEANFADPFVQTADVLGYVHISESHCGMLGTGTINWDQVWQGLKQIDFDGFLVLASFAVINPELAAATCLWRPPAQSAEEIARAGLTFMQRGVAEHGLV